MATVKAVNRIAGKMPRVSSGLLRRSPGIWSNFRTFYDLSKAGVIQTNIDRNSVEFQEKKSKMEALVKDLKDVVYKVRHYIFVSILHLL